MSFEALWPLAERATVRELEQLLASGSYAQAVTVADQLVARSLASAANMLGTTSDAPRDPAVVALLLGIDGRRYLEFRALLREARAGRPIEPAEALAAFALAIDFRLARSKLGGLVGQSGRRPAAANKRVGQSGRRPAAATSASQSSSRTRARRPRPLNIARSPRIVQR